MNLGAVIVTPRPAVPSGLSQQTRYASLEIAAGSLLAASFSALDEAVFVLNAYGEILSLSAGARVWISGSTLLEVRAQRLVASDPLVRPRLEAAIVQACRGPSSAGRKTWISAISLGEADHSTKVRVAAIPETRWFTRFGPVALVLIDSRRNSSGDMLGRQFDLSPAELSICEAIGRGQSVKQIALARQVSIGTVRGQLKIVFSKTGVHRQSELVALISRQETKGPLPFALG